MSVFLMKTRDLTWQDRALNMEVMLEPKRNNLLFKKNKSLSMNYEKDRTRYSKQMNTKLRMFKTEKHYIDQKNQELYLVKTKRFLGSLTSEQRQKLLSRKSFSIGLSKLAKEIEEEEEYNERYSAPSTLNSRRVSLFGSFASSSSQNPENSNSRQDVHVVTTKVESPEPEVKLPNLPIKSQYSFFKMGRRFASPAENFRRFRSAEDVAVIDLETISNPHTPIPSYLPSASPIDRNQRTVTTDFENVESKRRTNRTETPEVGNCGAKKAVQFEQNVEKKQETPRNSFESEKRKAEKEKPMIQKKINSFLKRQSSFNKKAPICAHKKVNAIVNPDDSYNIDKGKLVNAFDEFCVKGGRDKLQRLVKYATKYKVTSTFKQSNVMTPSVETFKTSRTFMNIANASNVQPISARA